MSQTCSNLATKADLDALAAELENALGSKINNVEKASIVNISAQQGYGLAAAVLLPKIAKAAAAAAAIAAKVAALGASLAFLVAQVAALALLQYQISKNTQKISKNTKILQSNSARISINEQKINKNTSELSQQRAELEALKAQYPKLQQQINSTKVAISQNESAIANNEKKIAQNNKKIAQSQAQLKNDIAKAEAKLKQEINSAQASLNGQIASAKAEFGAKVQAINTEIIGLKAKYSADTAQLKQQFISQIQSISITLANAQGKITELQVKLALANGDAVITKKTTKTIEKDVNDLKTKVKIGTTTNFLEKPLQDLSKSINETKTGISFNTSSITNSNTKIKELSSKITALETAQMDTTQVKKLRTDISKDTQTIVAATIGTLVLPTLNQTATQTSPTAIKSATNNALCQQANNPSSCLNTKLFNPIQKNLGNIANGVGAGASAANTALNTNILNRVTDIQNVVNSSQFGLKATRQFLETAWNATGMDKILNAMNTALALHNAAMLSRNLGGSIGEVASSLLNAIGVKDSSGEEIDVNNFVTAKVQSIVNGVIGTENAEALSTGFNSFNRILVSAQGVVSATRAIKDAIQNGQEIIANRVGFLSNSFMEQGILEEGSYPWSDTNISFRRSFNSFVTRVESVQEIVDEINELVQSGIEIKENVKEISDNIETFQGERQKLEEALDELNTEKQKEEDDKELVNESPNITNSVLVKDEDQE